MIEKISSMGIVVTKNKNVLLLNSEGEWVFPKGHAEDGENFIDTAIREVKEEADVELKREQCKGQIDEFCFYFDGEKAKKVIKVILFEIEREQEIKFNEDECFIDGKWMCFEEAIEKLTHDDARGALKKAIQILNKKRENNLEER